MRRARRQPVEGVWGTTAALLLLAWSAGWAGCASPTAEWSSAGRDAATPGFESDAREPVTTPPVVAPGERLRPLVEAALERFDDAEFRRQAVNTAAGREFEFFEALLAKAARETRDVGPLLEEAAAAVGRARRDADLLAFVRELSHRGCCTRRSFLAASLDGLVRGLDEVGAAPFFHAEAVDRLERLAENADADLAEAARRAYRFFGIEEVGVTDRP